MIDETMKILSDIRKDLPKHLIPGFNLLVSENKEESWFDMFIYTYYEYVKESIEKGIEIITPAMALSEFKNKMEEDANSFDEFVKENNIQPTEIDEPSDCCTEIDEPSDCCTEIDESTEEIVELESIVNDEIETINEIIEDSEETVDEPIDIM